MKTQTQDRDVFGLRRTETDGWADTQKETKKKGVHHVKTVTRDEWTDALQKTPLYVKIEICVYVRQRERD